MKIPSNQNNNVRVKWQIMNNEESAITGKSQCLTKNKQNRKVKIIGYNKEGGEAGSGTVLEWFTCRKMGKNLQWICFSGSLVQVSLAKAKRQTSEIWSKEKDIKKIEWGEGLHATFSFWPLYSTHIFLTLTHTRSSGGNVGIGKWSMRMKQLEKHYISLWNK